MILRAVGDYKDTFDATTGKITRRVGVKVLTGTENTINTYNMLQITAILNPAREKGAGWQKRGLCTHAVAGTATTSSRLVEIDATATYFGGDFGFTAASGKQWLRDQYAAGTPVTLYYPLAEPVEEDWDGGATYCETPIKIATNLYNSAKFQNVIDALDTAVSTINNIVAGTIAQANSIGELASGKQTRPNPADSSDTTCPTSCPNYRQCLLVEKDDGTPCWYEINDPFYNFTRPILGANLNGASYTYANGVPNAYTQLEYIEKPAAGSDNYGAYIDTGIYLGSDTKIEFKTDRPTPPPTGTVWNPFGAVYDGVSSYRLFESTPGSSTTGYIALTYGKVTSSQVNSIGAISQDNSVFVIDGGVCTYDNGDRTITSPQAGQTFKQTRTNWLFAANGSNTGNKLPVKLYYFKIWENGTLVRNFVPAKRNSDNEIGMFDTVTGQFFTNAGTGTFVAGNPVPNQQATWSVTWPASVANNFAGGTAYGEIMCNNVQGTWRTPATTSQMNNANWNTPGQYCWCGMKNIYNGNENVPVSNNVWVFAYSSDVQYTTINACYANCAKRCGQKVYDDMLFTQSVFGM